jgi:hypothetical protein
MILLCSNYMGNLTTLVWIPSSKTWIKLAKRLVHHFFQLEQLVWPSFYSNAQDPKLSEPKNQSYPNHPTPEIT